MKVNLYDRIATSSKDERIREILSSLNLDGYSYLDNLKVRDEFKDDIIRYVVLAYSYNSEMLRTDKERKKVKELIARKVGLDLNDRLVNDILKNKDSESQRFVTWWLNENEHPLWRRYISGLDLEAEKLEIARSGLDITIQGTIKDVEKAAKQLSKDSKLKTQAFQDAVLIRKQLDDDKLKLDKAHEYLEGIVKKEVPEFLGDYESWAEYLVMKSSQKKNSPKISFVPIESNPK